MRALASPAFPVYDSRRRNIYRVLGRSNSANTSIKLCRHNRKRAWPAASLRRVYPEICGREAAWRCFPDGGCSSALAGVASSGRQKVIKNMIRHPSGLGCVDFHSPHNL